MLNEHLDWPGVKQVCQLQRKTLRQGVWSTEVAYAITSVGRDRADSRALLDWWRGHWEKTGKVDVELADRIPDGWQHWLTWQGVQEEDSARREATMLRVDAGRHLGFTRLVARRKPVGRTAREHE